jgi:hypothetical protein
MLCSICFINIYQYYDTCDNCSNYLCIKCSENYNNFRWLEDIGKSWCKNCILKYYQK